MANITERSDLTVVGMTCGGCAAKVQSALADVDGVVDAQVNFATARATVRHEGRDEAAFIAVIEGLGYSVRDAADLEAAEQARSDDLKRRFLFSAVLTVPAMAISMIMPLRFDGWAWVVGALVTPVVFWSGAVFHRATWANLRHRTTTMDTLVTIGTLSAWSWSSVELLRGAEGHIYFETAAVIITLILLGKWIETAAKRRSGAAIRALADLGAVTAQLVDGRRVEVDALQVGDRFIVKPGEKIPTDGIVIDGRAAVDASMVSGEPVPVEVTAGSEVIGATIATDGALTVEATRVGSQTALAQIIRLVDEAQGSRAAVQRLADRVAGIFVPAAIGIALVTLVAWLVFGDSSDDAFTAAVAVLIIACPCALGLATPLGIMVGTGRGAELGIIIKGGEVLEDTRAVETVVLDKTGTLTEGEMSLAEIVRGPATDAGLTSDAARVERLSEHPIAQAIAGSSVTDDDRGGPNVEDFQVLAGRGVTGTVDGRPIVVGRRSLFSSVEPTVAAGADAAEAKGTTVVFAGRGEVAQVAFVVSDRVKATTAQAIAGLHRSGMRTVLLTGDNATTARAVADEVGIDEVIAEVLPDEKAAVIERLRSDGRRVAMVGDGINDAPALAAADLGIALGTGTDIAIEASDLTIVSGDLRAVRDAISLSRRTLATIKGNLFWAFAYNAGAIPLAAIGVLNPMIAAAAMGMSSIFVVTNSLRLRSFRGTRTTD
jgi:Cu+-exporting ATPase